MQSHCWADALASAKHTSCLNSLRPSDAYIKNTNIASDNGLSPIRRQAITWTDAARQIVK